MLITLKSDRSLTNRAFQSYKLNSDPEQQPTVHSLDLPAPSLLTRGKLNTANQLQVIAYCFQMNCLTTNPFRWAEAVYFDDKHALWKINASDKENFVEKIIDPIPQLDDVSFPSVGYLTENKIVVLRGNTDKLEIFDDETLEAEVAIPEHLKNGFLQIVACRCGEGSGYWIALLQIIPGEKIHFKIHILRLQQGNLSVTASYESLTRPLLVHLYRDGIAIGSGTIFVPSTSPTKDQENLDEGGEIPETAAHGIEYGKSDQPPNDDPNSMVIVKYSFETGNEQWRTEPVTYIGPFIDRAYPDKHFDGVAFAAKSSHDAAAFIITAGPAPTAAHVKSFDALNFVQSGKQDRRYTIFLPDYSLIVESSKHIYFYKARVTEKACPTLPQFLVQLDSDERIQGYALLFPHLLTVISRSKCYLLHL